MDLRYTPEEKKFRDELAAWLAAEVPAHGKPPSVHDWPARRAYDTSWQRKLFDAGYAGINWPKEYGGRDATLVEQLIYFEEIAKANAPYVGVKWAGRFGETADIARADGRPTRDTRVVAGVRFWF